METTNFKDLDWSLIYTEQLRSGLNKKQFYEQRLAAFCSTSTLPSLSTFYRYLNAQAQELEAQQGSQLVAIAPIFWLCLFAAIKSDVARSDVAQSISLQHHLTKLGLLLCQSNAPKPREVPP